MTIGTKQNICIGFYDTEGLTQPLCFVYPCVFTCTPFSDVSKFLIFPCKNLLSIRFIHLRRNSMSKNAETQLRLGLTTMHSKWSLYLVCHEGLDRQLCFACGLPPRLPSRSPSDHSLFECSPDIRITLMPSRVRIPPVFV